MSPNPKIVEIRHPLTILGRLRTRLEYQETYALAKDNEFLAEHTQKMLAVLDELQTAISVYDQTRQRLELTAQEENV